MRVLLRPPLLLLCNHKMVAPGVSDRSSVRLSGSESGGGVEWVGVLTRALEPADTTC
jgi:hypothetical protein